MSFPNSNNILKRLELISERKGKRLLRLKGYVNNKNKDYLEIIIFKGFSSSITHPTEFDLSNSTLPNNAILEDGEILEAPMDPKNEVILIGPININQFLNEKNWLE